MKKEYQHLTDTLVDVLRKKLCKFSIPELIEFKKMQDAMNGSLYDTKPVDPDLLVHLVRRVKQRMFNLPGYTLDNFLSAEPYVSACGCMGPRGGEPFCNCVMVSYGQVYKFDVAIAILQEFE